MATSISNFLYNEGHPIVIIIGRVMWVAPSLFGTKLKDASPNLRHYFELFRAADIDSNWVLSVIEFHTFVSVIMENPHFVTIYDVEQILFRLDSWGSHELTIEEWVWLCLLDLESFSADADVTCPFAVRQPDEESLAKKVS